MATFPQIKLSYRIGSPQLENMVTTLRQMWKSTLGVEIGIDGMDFNKLLDLTQKTACQDLENPASCQNKGLQMWINGWAADYADPQDWISLQFARGMPNNEWNYGQNL